MKHVDLMFFDLDGTLVDSKDDIVNAINVTLEHLGLGKKGASEIISYIGIGMHNLIKRSLGEGNEIHFDNAILKFKDYYRKHLTDKTTLYPNVKEVLEHFNRKKKAIVSNRRHELTLAILKEFKLHEHFEKVFGGDDSSCAKPSSCNLDRIIDEYKIDRKKAIMIGDMDIDILAGKNAGVATCGITYGMGKIEDIIAAKPDFIINNIVELKKLVL